MPKTKLTDGRDTFAGLRPGQEIELAEPGGTTTRVKFIHPIPDTGYGLAVADADGENAHELTVAPSDIVAAYDDRELI